MSASATALRLDVPIRSLSVQTYRVPTEGGPESDGTIVWDATTMVFVRVEAGDAYGIGYSYADGSTATLIRETLHDVVIGTDAGDTTKTWAAMGAKVRNLGRDGIASMAISAVDVALWDLRAKLLGAPVCALLGMARHDVPVYGSGGFTSYDVTKLQSQLGGWVHDGIPRVKMKVGRDPGSDAARVRAARAAIGDAELYVDANGAYSHKQAAAFALAFAESDVTWYEEPVYHQDFDGLAEVRAGSPAGMEIASGEYGYGLDHFARMLAYGAVDVLQADATRCGGFTGLLAVDGLCRTNGMPLSTHCAPHLHLHAGASMASLRHMEYFFDHARIERMFFDGAEAPRNGALTPDLSRPGIGLELRAKDVERYAC